MSEEIKFTKEQIDYIKHCGEHFEVLTGGRGHSKTKQIIEQLQQENQQLKDVIEEVRKYIEETPIGSILEVHCGDEEEYTKPLLQILDKVKENK